MRQCLGCAFWLLALTLACGEPERPPPAADPVVTEEEGSLVDPEEEPGGPPAPESSCGAATVSLDFVRPNLYFAVDASGSMLEGIPAGTADSGIFDEVLFPPRQRYGALALAIETLLARIGHRVNYGALLFPSGQFTCDSGEEVMALTPGDTVSFAVSGEPGPVLSDLMFYIRRRSPSGGTPVAAALERARASVLGQSGDTYVFLVTDGAPNCNPATSCGPETCIPNIERLQLTDSLVCDEAINCCDGSWLGPENCLDDGGSLAAIEELARAGVRTFVIGIPGSDAYANVLDRLAVAGGMPRAGSPSYYRADDAEELITTVGALGRTVALGCTIALVEPPPDPNLVNLYFDGELVPADPVDGWAFADPRTVEIRGAACALMQAGQVLQAEVVAGCPVVIR